MQAYIPKSFAKKDDLSLQVQTPPPVGRYYGIRKASLVDIYGEKNCVAVSFNIRPDPSCCGLKYLYSIVHNEKVPFKELEPYVAELFTGCSTVEAISNRQVQFVAARPSKSEPYYNLHFVDFLQRRGFKKVHSFINENFHDHICDIFHCHGKAFRGE